MFTTTWGWAGVAFSSVGLCQLVLPDPDGDYIKSELGIQDDWTEAAENQFTGAIRRYFTGERVDLAFLIDWSWATPFQRQVLELVKQIPYGHKESYGSIAAKMGKAQAFRAVGGALSRNRVPLVIPCHRVLAKGRDLGGFTSRNGLGDKITLLKLEGILEVRE